MEILEAIHRWTVRKLLYIKAVFLAVLTRRQIDIKLIQVSGIEGHYQMSYQVKVLLPGQKIHLECLRAAPLSTKPYKVVNAVRIAEEIGRELSLLPTQTFIKTYDDTIVVTVKGS